MTSFFSCNVHMAFKTRAHGEISHGESGSYGVVKVCLAGQAEYSADITIFSPPERASNVTDDVFQVGPAQVGAAQVGAAQVGAAQVGPARVGIAQVGIAQVGAAQVGIAQVGAAQVGPAQVGIAQVGSNEYPAIQVSITQK